MALDERWHCLTVAVVSTMNWCSCDKQTTLFGLMTQSRYILIQLIYLYMYAKLFQYMYHASCITLYYDQPMQNYLTNYHTPTCFDTIVSSSGSF